MVDKTTGAMQEFGTPAAPGAGPTAGLVLLYAEEFPNLPAVWPLTRQRALIGRDESADLRIVVNAVSRTHAEVAWERGTWVLRDLGSRNGTFVDGVAVSGRALHPDPKVRLIGAEAFHRVRVGDPRAVG